MPAETSSGQTTREDDLALVVASQLDHREDVAEGEVLVVCASVLCDVVCAVVNDNDLRLEVDDVFAETQQELIRSLSADASSDEISVICLA